MAENKSTPKRTRAERAEADDKEAKAFVAAHTFQFVNYELGESEREEVLDNPITAERLQELVKEVLLAGYKLGCSRDNKHNTWVISITGAKFWRDDYNLCVTSRHSDLWVAFAAAEYKFVRFIKPHGIDRPEPKSEEYLF
jgi:hypothetical protein